MKWNNLYSGKWIKKFALFPTNVNGQTIWFEHYFICYVKVNDGSAVVGKIKYELPAKPLQHNTTDDFRLIDLRYDAEKLAEKHGIEITITPSKLLKQPAHHEGELFLPKSMHPKFTPEDAARGEKLVQIPEFLRNYQNGK